MNLFQSKIAKNASWIILSRVIQAVLGLVISMLTARYLGPDNYGLINYAASLVNFIMPVVFLGLNNTLVQELTRSPEREGEILGTSIAMSMVSALCCIAGVWIFARVANPGETTTIAVCMLYSLILIFQVLDLIQYWFQSKLMSKYSSIAALCSYLTVSAYKFFLLVTHKSVHWFAVSNTLDYLIISVSLLVLYRRLGGQKLSVSLPLAKYLFSRSRLFIATGLMVAIFAQTDKIMLKQMIDTAATGFYSAAAACAGLTNFIYAAIIDSFRPVIFQAHKESEERFERNLIRLYSIIIYLSLAQCVGMTLLAKPIILILYGKAYAASVNALRIITWYVTFSYIGSVRTIWILSKDLQRYLWMINLSGALLNVVLNFLLIPIIGIYGAALASFVTQFFTNFLIGFIIQPIRPNNRLVLQSLNPKYLKEMLMFRHQPTKS